MPELPEVEITARLLEDAAKGATVSYARAPGINALKSFHPPLSAIEGERIVAVGRRGKHLIVHTGADLALLIHLMSAGRLQLFDKPASPRERSSRLLVGLDDGRELRLREFGSKQAAWVKLLSAGELAGDDALATLGPEAWPDPGTPERLRELLDAPRPLHTLLRDQHVIAGIGRSWVDEILWRARLSPYKRGGDLDAAEAERLRAAIVEALGGALAHYEQAITLPIPDKLPMPLRVHRRQGEPCPRCATEWDGTGSGPSGRIEWDGTGSGPSGGTLQAVHFEDYVIAYCPTCQTEGRVLKDRRLSRLLR